MRLCLGIDGCSRKADGLRKIRRKERLSSRGNLGRQRLSSRMALVHDESIPGAVAELDTRLKRLGDNGPSQLLIEL